MTRGHGSQPVVAGHATQGRRRVTLVACTPMGYNIAHLGGVADTAFRAPTWFRELSGAVATSYYTGPGTRSFWCCGSRWWSSICSGCGCSSVLAAVSAGHHEHVFGCTRLGACRLAWSSQCKTIFHSAFNISKSLSMDYPWTTTEIC